MTKLYGAPRCDETAVNLNFKSSLYRSRLQRFPTLPQIREEIDFRGEWTQTAHEEDFLLVDTGQNDQNCLVPFATVGNLEKFCEAETIYIDRTFKASPQLFYQLFTVHAVYNGQHIRHTVNRIPASSSYRQHHFFLFFSKCTLSIPTSSTSHFVNSHFVNTDQMGIDKVEIDEVGRYLKLISCFWSYKSLKNDQATRPFFFFFFLFFFQKPKWKEKGVQTAKCIVEGEVWG